MLFAMGCFSDPEAAPADDDDAAGGTTGFASSTLSGTSPATTSGSASTSGSVTSDATTAGNGSEATTANGSGETTDPPTTAGGLEGSSSTGPTESSETASGAPCADPTRVAYLNFDGVTLEQSRTGLDDAPTNSVARSGAVGTWAAYQENDTAAIVQAAAEAFAGYDLCVTDIPPTTPVYEMVVVTSDPHPSVPTLIADLNRDCNDSNPADVQLLFLRSDLTLDSQTRGYAAASLIGYGLGLDTVDAPDDIMKNGYADGESDLSFTGRCQELAFGQVCASQTSCSPAQQDAAAHLIEVLGPALP